MRQMGLHKCALALPFPQWWSPPCIHFQPLAALWPGDHGRREQSPSSTVRRCLCLSSSILGQLTAGPWTAEEGDMSWWF